jgi:negative regulator of flagellin synthesis FlgM
MKGISSNTALDAYQRMAVSPVGGAKPASPTQPQGQTDERSADAAKVSISSQARSLAAQAASGPVDTQKVSELKTQLTAGTYQIDPQRIASRMLGIPG